MTLKDARELVGLTQMELERRAGLKHGTIHDLESGRTEKPSWEFVARIVTALQASGLKNLRPEDVFPVSEVR